MAVSFLHDDTLWENTQMLSLLVVRDWGLSLDQEDNPSFLFSSALEVPARVEWVGTQMGKKGMKLPSCRHMDLRHGKP